VGSGPAAAGLMMALIEHCPPACGITIFSAAEAARPIYGFADDHCEPTRQRPAPAFRGPDSAPWESDLIFSSVALTTFART